MAFMDLTPPKKRRLFVDHLLIVSAVAVSLATFLMANDEVTGKAEVSDAVGFTVLFLGLGYFLAWLPRIWAKTKGTMFESVVTPLFIGLTLVYFYLGFRSYFIQPQATGLMIMSQLLALICLSCRSAAIGS